MDKSNKEQVFLIIREPLSKKEYDRLKSEIDEAFKGRADNLRPILLEGDFQVVKV